MTTNNRPEILQLLRSSTLPLLIFAFTLVIALGDTTASDWLRYDREKILAYEVWRMISSHLVHLGWKHLFMNLAGLGLIWLLFGRLLCTQIWIITMLLSAAVISAGLLLFNPTLEWYVGLSGVLHAMFVTGAIASIIAGNRAEILLLLGLAGKLAWEQISGALPGSAEFAGGNVIVDAHLYGTITGLAVAIIFWRKLSRALN